MKDVMPRAWSDLRWKAMQGTVGLRLAHRFLSAAFYFAVFYFAVLYFGPSGM